MTASQESRSPPSPHNRYLPGATDKAEKGCVVPAWMEGSIVVTLPMRPIAQHKVHGDSEVEHGSHVDTRLPAGVEGLRVAMAGVFHCCAVVRRGHNELVLPEGQDRERARRAGGGEGGMEVARGKCCHWGSPSRDCTEQSCQGLHSPRCLEGMADGVERKHGCPLGWGDVTDAAADVERMRRAWRGRPGG